VVHTKVHAIAALVVLSLLMSSALLVLPVSAKATVGLPARDGTCRKSASCAAHRPDGGILDILHTLFGGNVQSVGNTLLGASLRVINQSNDINNSAILIFQKVISEL